MSAVAPSTDTAWAELHTNIRGFVARRVRQPADVDDIVQQVFLRVHQALPTLRDADKLHAWIYQTTRRSLSTTIVHLLRGGRCLLAWPRTSWLRTSLAM